MKKKRSPGAGRKKLPPGEALVSRSIRLPGELWKRVEAYARARQHRSRNASVVHLIQFALDWPDDSSAMMIRVRTEEDAKQVIRRALPRIKEAAL